MRELAESNPRLLSLSTLYPVAKEDFVLHLFYAHKGEEKLVNDHCFSPSVAYWADV